VIEVDIEGVFGAPDVDIEGLFQDGVAYDKFGRVEVGSVDGEMYFPVEYLEGIFFKYGLADGVASELFRDLVSGKDLALAVVVEFFDGDPIICPKNGRSGKCSPFSGKV